MNTSQGRGVSEELPCIFVISWKPARKNVCGVVDADTSHPFSAMFAVVPSYETAATPMVPAAYTGILPVLAMATLSLTSSSTPVDFTQNCMASVLLPAPIKLSDSVEDGDRSVSNRNTMSCVIEEVFNRAVLGNVTQSELVVNLTPSMPLNDPIVGDPAMPYCRSGSPSAARPFPLVNGHTIARDANRLPRLSVTAPVGFVFPRGGFLAIGYTVCFWMR